MIGIFIYLIVGLSLSLFSNLPTNGQLEQYKQRYRTDREKKWWYKTFRIIYFIILWPLVFLGGFLFIYYNDFIKYINNRRQLVRDVLKFKRKVWWLM